MTSQLHRNYHSDTSIYQDAGRTAAAHAAGARPLFETQSDPAISSRKPHPLLDDADIGRPYTSNELVLGAETLENIVAEGAHLGATLRRFRSDAGARNVGREMSDRVLRLVYGTMKFLPYIDTILVKTQFLVYNNQFLNHLALVKIMLYDLIKYHCDYIKYPGIATTGLESSVSSVESQNAELVKDLDEALRKHGVKIAAAFARIRIERRAAGDTVQEQVENILPEEVRAKENLAASREEVAQELRESGYKVELSPIPTENIDYDDDDEAEEAARRMKDCIYLDDTFDDLMVIPTELFSEIKSGNIVTEGRLVFQDKASVYAIKHAASLLKDNDHVIDTRAGCGVNVAYLAAIMRNKGKIFAFESRLSRLESLKARLANQNVKNVEIIESEFITSDADEERFAKVSTILVEAPNSGTAIVDKLGYLLQEEEFPSEQCTQKDIISLRRQQANMMKHAFNFPNVKNIIYITRSNNRDENEMMVEELIYQYGKNFELTFVLPDIISDMEHEWEYEECLKLKPSPDGNGVFIACFSRIVPEPEIEEPLNINELEARMSITSINTDNQDIKRTRKSKAKKDGKTVAGGKTRTRKRVSVASLPRLSKTLAVSVNRLSVPRNSSTNRNSIVKRKSVDKIRRHDSKNEELEEVQQDGERKSVAKEKQKSGEEGAGSYDEALDVDISVFGISLKQFYAPKAVAIESLKTMPEVVRKWRYPVPNPKPWK
ncbi:hypothetical protein HDV05_006375 [Chytridiales sp. JEL 0842]|nr:hypothetical protein HDV05_006375 [Chytridiales sp. JEL 0842]